MPSGLNRSYGAHHLHFITCSCCHGSPFLTARSRDRVAVRVNESRPEISFRASAASRKPIVKASETPALAKKNARTGHAV